MCSFNFLIKIFFCQMWSQLTRQARASVCCMMSRDDSSAMQFHLKRPRYVIKFLQLFSLTEQPLNNSAGLPMLQNHCLGMLPGEVEGARGSRQSFVSWMLLGWIVFAALVKFWTWFLFADTYFQEYLVVSKNTRTIPVPRSRNINDLSGLYP